MISMMGKFIARNDHHADMRWPRDSPCGVHGTSPQNVPNRNVRTPEGPLSSEFDEAAELTPVT